MMSVRITPGKSAPSIERFSTLASHLVVSGMMVCIAVTVVQVGLRLSPGWRGEYLLAVAFLVSLESMVTHRTRRNLPILSPDWLVYRLTEWVVILVFLKLVLYLAHGLDQLWVDLPLWARSLGNFFTSEMIFTAVFAFLIWVVSAELAGELAELESEEVEYRSPDPSGVPLSRAQIRQRLADRILIVGGLLIFFTALLRIDWQARWLAGPPPRGGLYNLLAYFLLGMVLLGLTQYSILRAGWRSENIPFSREIAVRWAVYGSIFILGVAVISSLLPTGYSIGLLAVLGYLISLLFALFRLLWFLLTLPVFLVWALLAMLFKGEMDQVPAPVLPEPPAVIPGADAGAPFPWLEALKSLLFWAVFLGVVYFSLRYYLQEHRELVEQLRKMPLVGWFIGAWAWLQNWARGVNRQVSAAVLSRLRSLRREGSRSGSEGVWRYVNLRRLQPRQQVMFFYQALLRRGGEGGFPRRPSQTPYEYSRALKAGLPIPEKELEAGEDIRILTDRFVEARYSRHEITSDHASLARRCWERIRKVLKKA